MSAEMPMIEKPIINGHEKNVPLEYKTQLYGERTPLNKDVVKIVITPLDANRSLEDVLTPDNNVDASGNENFAAENFGRDACRVSRDTLPFRPEIAQATILTLVKYQATHNNAKQDAHTGAYHHERLSEDMIEKQTHLTQEVKQKQREKIKHLGPLWGGTEHEMTYYGARDVTPLAINLIDQFNDLHPEKKILQQTVERANGEKITVKESVKEATSHVVNELLTSDRGLMEYQRENPAGIANQYWKDSATSLLFSNGEIANHNGPVAELSIQAATYDALKSADKMLTSEEKNAIVSKEAVKKRFEKDEIRDAFTQEQKNHLLNTLDTQEGSQLKVLAMIVQQQVLKKFWMKDKKFFAPALDRDPNTATTRQLDTLTSNAVGLLNSSLLEDLPEEEKKSYLEPTVGMLLSPEFVTDAGIRCAAVQHENLINFSGYHWSHAVWAKDTEEFAQGLKRHGLYSPAEQMRIRMLNTLSLSGTMLELQYVDAQGRVNYDPHGKQTELMESNLIERGEFIATNKAEENQAWTSSSVLRAQSELQESKEEDPSSWQYAFKEKLFQTLPKAKLFTTPEEIANAYPNHYHLKINVDEGINRDRIYNKSFWDKREEKTPTAA